MMTTFPGPTSTAAETQETGGFSPRWRTIAKRALQLSFLFFLIKGLAWLAVGFLAWRGLT
jgi:hypothetical protein